MLLNLFIAHSFIPIIVMHVKQDSKFTIDDIAQFIQKYGWYTAVSQIIVRPKYQNCENYHTR